MKAAKGLRLTRVVLEAVAFGVLTGFLTSQGVARWPAFAQAVARVQLFPAAMAFGMTVFVGWMIVTIIFGRIYCSTVCPIGALQDVVARMHQRPRRYRFRPADNRLRYTVLAVVATSLLAGITIIGLLLDPYSAYERIIAELVRPVLRLLFTPAFVAGGGTLLGIAVAALTLAAVVWTAWRGGRTICNTVCPVGSTLGLVSRYSIYHIDINTDLCIQCGKCEEQCKAHCINLKDHIVDSSRCVVCFNCLPVCPNEAIRYTPSSHRLQLPMMMKVEPPAATAANAVGTSEAAQAINSETDYETIS